MRIVIILLLTMILSSPSLAQLPYGFEIVEIVADDYELDVPAMNDCGQVVFSQRPAENISWEIYRYDNGLLTRISFSNNIRAHLPDLNNPGDIVWYVGQDPNGDIHLLSGGQETVLGWGNQPDINDLGHVVWFQEVGWMCQYILHLFYYDGDTVSQLTFGEVNDQSPDINNNGWIVWTRYDFCQVPWWESEIILYVDGKETVLPHVGSQPQGPSLNQHGMIVWASVWDVELWDGQTTSVVQEWPTGTPELNNWGDYTFLKWDFSMGTWHQWLYCASCDVPKSYQLTNDLWSAGGGGINDYTELVWVSYNQPNWNTRAILYLRRIRNGDVDNDRDVDSDDFATMPGCLTGPVATDRLCDCRFFDMDHDRDVDLADFALFQNAFGQTNLP